MAQSPEELKHDIERTRQDLSRDVEALNEKVSPSRIVGRRVERVRGGLSGWKEKVMGTASDTAAAADSVGNAASSVTDAVSGSPAAAKRQVRGNPLAAGLVAFSAGWIIASLLPASDTETKLAHDLQDTAAGPVKEQATHLAQELKENLRQPTQDAVQEIKETASEAVSTVGEEGRSAAGSVRDDAQNAADNLRQSSSDDPGRL